MKKLFLYSLALACASNAMAQDSTTMVFNNGGTIVVNATCSITGVTSLQLAGGTVSLTGGTLAGSGCGSGNSGGGGNTTSTASVSPASQNFTVGSATPPSVSVTSSDAGVSCSFSGSPGTFSGRAGSSVTLATPSAAGTTAYSVSCTSTTAGITSVVGYSSSVSVVASAVVNSGGCASSQTASVNGVTLSRLCSGPVVFPYPGAKYSYTGDITDMAVLLHGTWGTYKTTGFPWTIAVPSGSYISLAFTPTDATHALTLNANTTFGDGGTVWVSPTPGGPPVNNGYCTQSYNGSNNLTIYPFAGYACSVAVGTTYYVNIADIDPSGGQWCSNGAGSCSSSVLSYTAY